MPNTKSWKNCRNCETCCVGIVNENTASGQTHVSKMIRKLSQKKYVLFKLLRLRYKLYTCPNLCYNVHVQSATQWTFSVQTLRMPKPVISFLLKVLCNGLLRHILYACVKTCENVSVQTAMPWTAAVHFCTCPNL